MNNKNNPWMLATIFLIGLIAGFGLGRINMVSPTTQVAMANNGSNTAAVPTADGSTDAMGQQPPQTLQTSAVNDYSNVPKSLDATGHYSLGNPNSKVKVVEFSDFQCPFCYRYFTSTFPQIFKDYITTGKIYYSFYTFPLDIHPQAQQAANAALCAGEQNEFWEYHDLLFANQNLWSGNDNYAQVFENLAQSSGLGIDSTKFAQCVTSNKYMSAIQKDMDTGNKKGITGTPTIFVNDQKIVGAQDYYVFQQAIEDELKK